MLKDLTHPASFCFHESSRGNRSLTGERRPRKNTPRFFLISACFKNFSVCFRVKLGVFFETPLDFLNPSGNENVFGDRKSEWHRPCLPAVKGLYATISMRSKKSLDDNGFLYYINCRRSPLTCGFNP